MVKNTIIVSKATSAFLIQYITNINTNIAIIHTRVAINAHENALSHKVGDIFSSCLSISGAGRAHSFNEFTNSFADCGVNCQSICAHYQHFLIWIVCDLCRFHHINIAI